ncbi:MAG TPA: ABC transporter ATP-binding protein [Anaerolineales bacterium]|nr:ABC transporter ATP-binding protein [Anaerolineales bacterium]
MEPFIVCENLVKIYQLNGIEVVALQGLDLAVQQGEVLGIVGASGSGKTTLLNVLGGLDRPSAGKVVVDGQDLIQISAFQQDIYRRKKVGFVWQQSNRNLISYLSALENVELPQRMAGVSAKERRHHTLDLLESLGLGERLHHRPAMLSGGEQQRVAIAVALANKPDLLLADEPTGEVDTATALEVYAALRRMADRYGMTTLIVSHDPNIGHHTDRVVAIRDGKTSTETVRVNGNNNGVLTSGKEPDTPKQKKPEATLPVETTALAEQKNALEFEELVVLDSAGRLQIPRDYLESLNIGDRVRLELKDGQLMIHPVAGRGRAAPVTESEPDFISLYMEEDLPPEPSGKSLAARLRKLSPLPSMRREKQTPDMEMNE